MKIRILEQIDFRGRHFARNEVVANLTDAEAKTLLDERWAVKVPDEPKPAPAAAPAEPPPATEAASAAPETETAAAAPKRSTRTKA